MQITTLPLQAKFLAKLDKYRANLIKLFSNTGAAGRKIQFLTALTAKASALNCCII